MPKAQDTQFTERLKSLRKAHGLTIKYLAEQLGVSEAYISMLAAGKRAPNRKFIQRLAKVLAPYAGEEVLDELLILGGFSPEKLQHFVRPEDPLENYRKALDTHPHDFNLYLGYLSTLIKTERFKEAQSLIQQGFQRFQNAYQLHALTAHLELSHGHLDSARLAQEAALAQLKNQNHGCDTEAILRSNLGGICFQQGLAEKNTGNKKATQTHFATARALFLEALELAPDNVYTLDEYARLSFNQAELASDDEAQSLWQEAIHSFQQVLSAPERDTLGSGNLKESAVFCAYAQAKAGALDTAENMLQMMTLFQPPYWFAHYALACVAVLFYHRTATPLYIERAQTHLQTAQKVGNTEKINVMSMAKNDPDLSELFAENAAGAITKEKQK